MVPKFLCRMASGLTVSNILHSEFECLISFMRMTSCYLLSYLITSRCDYPKCDYFTFWKTRPCGSYKLFFTQFCCMFRLSISAIIRKESSFNQIKKWTDLSLKQRIKDYCKICDYYLENVTISDIESCCTFREYSSVLRWKYRQQYN
jgi:hypothetical protein